MWDDATALCGRQTKRKWSFAGALVLVALLFMGGAWLAANGAQWEKWRTRPVDAPAEVWTAVPEGSAWAMAGQTVLGADGARLWRTELSGQTSFSEQALEAPVMAGNGGYAVVYEQGGQSLTVAGPKESRTLEIPAGIDQAAAGPQGQAAAITAGSGYLTVTRHFAWDGTELEPICLGDRAMVMLAYLHDGTLASCCVSREGKWSLRLDGAGTLEIPLEGMVYELRPCGRGLALWTSGGVCFYDADGETTGTLSIRESSVLDWDCGTFAAFVVCRFGDWHLVTVSPDGQSWDSGPLDRQPAQVLVCGDRVCLLDSEALLVYDSTGALLQRDRRGARSGRLLAADGGVVLLGDGELLYKRLS